MANLFSELPTVHRMTEMVLQKNTLLMGYILGMMVRAQKDKSLVLTSEDLVKIESFLVSPKDLYLQLIDEENRKLDS